VRPGWKNSNQHEDQDNKQYGSHDFSPLSLDTTSQACFSTDIREHSEHGKLFYITNPSNLGADYKPIAFKKP